MFYSRKHESADLSYRCPTPPAKLPRPRSCRWLYIPYTAPVHEFPARVALHGERYHHSNADLLFRISLHPRDFLRIKVRREVLVKHLSLAHGSKNDSCIVPKGVDKELLWYMGRENKRVVERGGYHRDSGSCLNIRRRLT